MLFQRLTGKGPDNLEDLREIALGVEDVEDPSEEEELEDSDDDQDASDAEEEVDADKQEECPSGQED